MFNVKIFMRQCALALSLGCAAVLAQANPMLYHVSVDTAGLGTSGSLDVGVGATNAAETMLATLSNFSAGFQAVDDVYSGVYGITPAGFSLTNGSGYNYLSQLVTFGGVLSFDVLFNGPFFDVDGTEATGFAVSLFDSKGELLNLVASFDFATTGADRITLTQGSGSATLIDPSAVPEPAALLLMLVALGAMGVMLRRRTQA